MMADKMGPDGAEPEPEEGAAPAAGVLELALRAVLATLEFDRSQAVVAVCLGVRRLFADAGMPVARVLPFGSAVAGLQARPRRRCWHEPRPARFFSF